MEEVTIARVLHVLGVVLWIGGVGMVTTVLESTFTLVTRLHWVLLAMSLVTVAGAVAGSHGYLLFTR